MRVLSLAIVFILAGAIQPAQQKSGEPGIEGTWLVVSAKKGTSSLPKGIKVVIAANKLTLFEPGSAKAADALGFRLDPSKSPKEIDLSRTAEAFRKDDPKPIQKTETYPGIYQLKDGELHLCWSMPRSPKKNAEGRIEDEGKNAVRPRTFDADDGRVLLILKREKN